MITLRQANRFDTRTSRSITVDPSRIESVGWALVGERSDGSKVTMQSGDSFLVWDSVDHVTNLISNHTEGK